MSKYKLSKIVLKGFKSFFRKTEIKVQPGITAIVGPNGCGKSNISDAISWVLGEQSLRTLRSSRMEELIFNGSSKQSPVSMGEVSLLLTPNGNPSSDGIEPLLITRRLYRSGESIFQINGRNCRLRDVLDRFMGTGLYTKAYSIIEQGRIEYIINSKPGEIRLLLEEAAGITKYKVKRNIAQNRLQSAEGNLLRLDDIISEVERQRNSLKRQAARARRYKNLSERSRQIDRKLLVIKYRQAEAQKKELSAKLSKQEENRDELKLLISQKEGLSEVLSVKMEQAEDKLQELNRQLYQSNLNKERSENEISYSLKRAEDYAANLQEHIRFIESSNKQLNGKLGESEKIKQQVKQEVIAADKISEELVQQEAICSKIEEERQQLRDKQEDKNSAFLAEHRNYSEIKNRLISFEEEEAKISQQEDLWQTEFEQLRSQEKSLEKEISLTEEKYTQRLRAQEKLKAEEENLRQQTVKLKEEIHQWQDSYRGKQDEIKQLGHRLRFLQKLVANNFPYLNALRVLKKVLATKEDKAIWDILANHIEVDKKYEVAIESLLSDLLQSIVVDSYENALKAIEYLHSQRLGYCTFIIKELMIPSEISPVKEQKSLLNEEGVIGRILDYIKISPLMVKNLERVISKAVLIENIEDGLRLRKRYPHYIMVSLRGEKLYPNGIIAGGCKSKQPGLLTLERQKQELINKVKEKHSSLKKLEGHLKEAVSSRESIEEEYETKAEKYKQLIQESEINKQELIKIRTQLSSIKERVLFLDRELQILRKNRTTLKHNKRKKAVEVAKAEERIKSQKSQINIFQKNFKQCENNLSKANEIKNDYKGQLSLLTERKNSLNRELRRLQEDIEAIREQQELRRNQIKELKQKQKNQIELAEKLKEELKKSNEENKELEGEIKQAKIAVASHRDEYREVGESIKNLRFEIEEKQEKLNELKLSLTEIESSLNYLSQDCQSSLKKKIEQLMLEEQLEDEDIDLSSYKLEREDVSNKLSRIGAVNLMAFEEFNRLDERYQFLNQQHKDIADSIESLQKAIRKINQISRQKFRHAFDAIKQNFRQTFSYFFEGGGAELLLLDEEDILESGIIIKAQPPGKRLQNINLLSGGEKALTALALLMAIFQFKPSPFCLLDEIDATLDEVNVGKLIKMLRELKQKTQFIIITHNHLTMEAADLIYGVTMEQPGISKVLSVKFDEQKASH